MSREEKLKPCPFCGGEAKLLKSWYNGKFYFVVKCLRCFTVSDIYAAQTTAVDRWNSRVTHGKQR